MTTKVCLSRQQIVALRAGRMRCIRYPAHKLRQGHLVDVAPLGSAGDLVWVAEPFKRVASGQIVNGVGHLRYGVAYQADDAVRWRPHTTRVTDLTGLAPTAPLQFRQLPWRSPTLMRRSDSRMTLIVTESRTMHLSALTTDQLLLEGFHTDRNGLWLPGRVDNIDRAARKAWDARFKAFPWHTDPLIVETRFTLSSSNIDVLVSEVAHQNPKRANRRNPLVTIAAQQDCHTA